MRIAYSTVDSNLLTPTASVHSHRFSMLAGECFALLFFRIFEPICGGGLQALDASVHGLQLGFEVCGGFEKLAGCVDGGVVVLCLFGTVGFQVVDAGVQEL